MTNINLNEIVEGSESLGVLALVDIDERSDFWGGERNVVVAQNNLQLLTPHAVRSRPKVVIFTQNLRILDNALQLLILKYHRVFVNKK